MTPVHVAVAKNIKTAAAEMPKAVKIQNREGDRNA